MQPDAPLQAGVTLAIPKSTLNANSASTFKPYDPSRVIGDANPALNALPQPQGEDGGCGDFAPIIELAIAIAVAYFAPEFLPELFAELGPVAGPIAQGATVAAIGNVATQVVGNVLGLQHGFDWKAVAFAALSGGVGEGLGASGLLPDVNNVLGNRILRAAIGSALTQGIGVATGLQKSFSWRSVALAGVSAGVGQVVTDLIAPELGNSDTGRFATRFASNTVGSLVANAAVGGRVSGLRVLTDGFGNALSRSWGGAGVDAGTQEQRLGTYQNPMVESGTGDHIVFGAAVPVHNWAATPSPGRESAISFADSPMPGEAASNLLNTLGLNNDPYSNGSAMLMARANVVDGRIMITPENSNIPSVNLPNNVGAKGFSPSDLSFHTYDVILNP